MKKIPKTISIFTSLTICYMLLTTSIVFASYDRLPETMVGQVTATQDGRNYYGGFTGNEAVYNYTNDDTNPSGGSGQSAGKSMAPSLKFDGDNDYVDIANPGTLAFDSGTFSAWVKPSKTGDLSYANGNTKDCEAVFAMDSVKNPDTDALEVYIGDGCINVLDHEMISFAREKNKSTYTRFGYEQDDPDIRKSMLYDGKWHHIAVTVTGITYGIYLDGVPLAVTEKKIGSGFSSTPSARYSWAAIGQRFNESERYVNFTGGIDDVRIYDTALSKDEVVNIYQGKSSDTANLQAHWNFDEGTGPLATDSSNNDHNGTLMENTTWSSTDGPLAVDSTQYKDNGYDLFGFDRDSLQSVENGCIKDIVFQSPTNRCFFSNSRNSNVKVMSSRTYVNQTEVTPVLEIAALYYPPNATIVGDAYLGDMSPTDFAYWGRNLVQNTNGTASSDSYWGVNYTIDDNVQAKLSGTEFDKYKSNIESLKGEATENESLSVGPWYLQTNNNLITNPGTTTTNTDYPQGRVWQSKKSTFELNILNTIQFEGQGTIIVNGNLIIDNGVDIKPKDQNDPDSMLGFIVLGDVEFKGNNEVHAAIFAAGSSYGGGNIKIGNNTDLIGSFVASDFPGLATASNNVRLYYDKRLNSAWPPGFRFLNMPHPTEN